MAKNKGKHLDLSKRQTIVNGLEQGLTAKQLGLLVGLDPTNISREIKRHRILRKFSNPVDTTICRDCMNKLSCTKQRSCSSPKCVKRCVGCENIKHCISYILMKCNRRERYPFVCNGCKKKDLCPLDKYTYEAKGGKLLV